MWLGLKKGLGLEKHLRVRLRESVVRVRKRAKVWVRKIVKNRVRERGLHLDIGERVKVWFRKNARVMDCTTVGASFDQNSRVMAEMFDGKR